MTTPAIFTVKASQFFNKEGGVNPLYKLSAKAAAKEGKVFQYLITGIMVTCYHDTISGEGSVGKKVFNDKSCQKAGVIYITNKGEPRVIEQVRHEWCA